MRQMEDCGQSKGLRLIGQVAIFVLIIIPLLLLSCSGDDDPPTVDAGPDQNVGTGTLVTLDGSGSDGINKNNVTCGWSFASVPPGSSLTNADIVGADTATPTFTPDVDGPYVLELEIAYGMFINRADTVTVTAWTTFEKTYGGSGYDYGGSVQQTSDDGFVVAGSTGSDVYLIKTDASGNSEWEKTYGGILFDWGLSIQQTTDGGFVISGWTASYGAGGSDVYLIKTDASGTPEWEKTYGGSSNDYGFSVRQTADGGFVAAGVTNSSGAGGEDVYLIKTDSSGALELEKTYGGSSNDRGFSVQQTTDGGFVVAGIMTYLSDDDVYLIKTDASGNPEWEKTYGGIFFDWGLSVQQTTDGGFVVAGSTSSFGVAGRDFYLIKTDASGTLEWEKTYGSLGSLHNYGNSVRQTTDGGFVVTGYTRSSGAVSDDIYLIKTDASGTLEWEKTYGGSDNDYGNSVQQTADGGFVIVGSTDSYGAGGEDVYLIKTDSMGNVY